MTCAGLPHSEIPGSKLICSSPRLIAAYHVLHRLLVPRHSPCALCSLTKVSFLYVNDSPDVAMLFAGQGTAAVLSSHRYFRGQFFGVNPYSIIKDQMADPGQVRGAAILWIDDQVCRVRKTFNRVCV